jgi:glutathione-specific gamma-glutamylcyclotransferase
MWDGWETRQGCVLRCVAELRGYCRSFNKGSVRNWGSSQQPCPTLNLTQGEGFCRGIAFEFPDSAKSSVLAYLKKREGRDFALRELNIVFDSGIAVAALVPLYKGKNLIASDDVTILTSLAVRANGTNGLCTTYIRGIFNKLCEMGIDDPAVSAVWRAVEEAIAKVS